MSCAPDYGCASADTALGIYEFSGFKKGLAGVTLVTSCSRASAVGTCAFNKPVGKKALTLGTVQLGGLLLSNVAGGIHLLEDVLDNLCLLGR